MASKLDLYSMPLGASPVALCGGKTGDANDDEEACVTAAPILGADGALAIGDSKNPGGPLLRFTEAELTTFVRAYATQRGITL